MKNRTVKECIDEVCESIHRVQAILDEMWPVDDSIVKASLELYDSLDELEKIREKFTPKG